MATFFVPVADSPEKAEEVRRSVVQFLSAQGLNVSDRRIHKLSYLHDGLHYDAEVGKQEARSRPGTGPKELGERVMLIFESEDRRLYFVCTPNRGVVRGAPILVGEDD